ncbi:MAG: DUF6113 family protein [Streptosporangiaceae bacterium]
MSSTRGSTAGGQPPQPRPGAGERTAITVAAYAALFLLGLMQGLIGTFQYSRGPVPLAAVLFDLAILATCLLGSWGMRTALGGFLPALGWFIVTLLLSSGSSGGSVFITDSTAGKWFLFGGAVCAVAGAVASYALWSRGSRDRRAGGSGSATARPRRPGQAGGSGRAGGSGQAGAQGPDSRSVRAARRPAR